MTPWSFLAPGIVAVVLLVTSPTRQTSASPATLSDVVFVASTPCDQDVRRMLTIPPGAGCDFIRWRLTLDAAGQQRFSLEIQFGEAQPNTLGFVGGGRRASLEGRFAIVRSETGSGDIYRLEPAGSALPIPLLEVNDNLLHVLSAEGRLLGGNGGWSYTLNRERPAQAVANPAFRLLSSRAIAPRGDVIFDGRTPCREIASRIGIPAGTTCFKVKWNLTLKVGAKTAAAGTYTLRRTGHRSEAITGRWEVRALGNNAPQIYTLDPGTPGSLSFLTVDDDALFMMDEHGRLLTGNGDFSYTLDRRASDGPTPSRVSREAPNSPRGESGISSPSPGVRTVIPAAARWFDRCPFSLDACRPSLEENHASLIPSLSAPYCRLAGSV